MSRPEPATTAQTAAAPAGEADPRPGEAADDEKPTPTSVLWRRARLGLSLALLAAAGYFLAAKASQLAAAWHLLGRLRWQWVAMAVLFEVASMIVFARMQRWLLRAGGVTVPLRTMVEITVAGNAVAATLPGGVAWGAAWVFSQLRRRGVSRFLRVWMFLVAGAISSFALFVVVASGIELAGSRGPVAGLRWGALALAAIPVLILGVTAVRNRAPVRRAGRRLLDAVADVRSGRWLVDKGRRLLGRVQAIRMSRVSWAEVMGLGLLNWLYDCAVLIFSLIALDVAVPWRGIFVVYGLTQIAAALPITPGGLGVVEGTLGALLHAYGVPVEQAVAVVIVYRIVSFWGLVPVGWGLWVSLDILEQHGRRVGRSHPWAEHRHGELPAPEEHRHLRLLPQPRPCLEPDCAGEGTDEEHNASLAGTP